MAYFKTAKPAPFGAITVKSIMIQPVRTGTATATLDPQRNYQLLIQGQGLCNARLDDDNFEDDFH
ncbi:MAG: hypothetical protein AAF679_10010, partial [Pseudomonadota bacterium]